MDLYDFQTDFGIYGDTTFATCAHEFFQTGLFRKYSDNVRVANFMNMPTWMWYPYVDLFFEKLMSVYDSDHIILNRFRSNTYYITKEGFIDYIPQEFKKPFHSNDAYNDGLARLEQYIIKKYKPWVIDLSKFYICDENKWDNLNGAHFEDGFYQETFRQIKRIINNETDNRYYDTPDFDYPFNGKLDVDNGIEMVGKLLDAGDILWLNLLNKLKKIAPEHEMVKEYVNALEEAYRE